MHEIPNGHFGKLLNRIRKLRVVGLFGAILYFFTPANIVTAKINYLGTPLIFRNNKIDLTVAMTNAIDEFGSLDSLLDRDSELNIVDAGAYIGTSAIVFRTLFPKAKILCLEPSTSNFELLSTNVNSMTGIRTINKALVGRSGLTVRLSDRMTGSWGHSVMPGELGQQKSKILGKVESTTLAEIKLKFGSIDILKLDVEGAEYLLWRDSPADLLEARVIIMETHESIVPGITELVEELFRGRDNYRSGEKIISISRPQR